jgi:hypothetical protein
VTLKPTTNTADKTLSVSISSAPGYQVDPFQGAVTMTIASTTLQPLPVVQVTATDDDAREAGLNPGQFTFTRSGPNTAPLRVYYNVSGTAVTGSPNSNRDYVALSGILDFNPGVSSINVPVTPLQDLESEMMETVVVTLSSGEYTVGSNNRATVYLDDDEPTAYEVDVVREGVHGPNASRPVYVRLVRKGTALSPLSWNWNLIYTFGGGVTLNGSSISGDVLNGNVHWPTRRSVANVAVNAVWSSHSSSTYNATLRFNNNSVTRPAPYNHQSQLVRVASVTSPATVITEGAPPFTTFVFTRLYPNGTSLNISYTMQGSAVAGTHYAALGGSLTFPANTATLNLSVQTFANSQTNGWKTGVLLLANQNGYVVDAGYDRALFRIQDAQVTPLVSDTDIDNDGLTDGWELANNRDPLAPDDAYEDADHDALSLFEELQLGTNPSVADAPAVFPSEDPDDYLPVTVRLGATGKLSDGNCGACHVTGARVGSHTRMTPVTSWEHPSFQGDFPLRLLRGTDYPVRLLSNPFSKVKNASETTGLYPSYSAHYSLQLLMSSNGPNYAFVSGQTQLLGLNKPLFLPALQQQATLHAPDLLIAADVDRDSVVNASNRMDRTATNAPFTFWINDDADEGSNDEAEDKDPAAHTLNSANTVIDGLRDLEDFARLHFRVEALPGEFATNAGIQTRLYLTNVAGAPSLRLFRTAEADGGTNYLSDLNTGNQQLAKTAFGVLSSGSPLTLSGSEWQRLASNRFLLPTLFEGISTGRCTVVFVLASNNGPVLATSRPFHLHLRKVTDLYEHWTVGDTATLHWSDVTFRPTNTVDSTRFAPPANNAEMDYILFVHGWRMQPWERRSFASTAFKRLYHLGYKGRFGLFSWPTEWAPLVGAGNWTVPDPSDPQNYDRSERKAWWSARGLGRLLEQLDVRHPGRVRIVAHSMGNVVASEALRRKGVQPSARPIVHAYVASQAATVAHAYDAVNPETIEWDWSTGTPEVYARNPVTGRPYFAGMTNAVGVNPQNLQRRIWNYHNFEDVALSGWRFNQDTKPDDGWFFARFDNTWRRHLENPDGGMATLRFPQDTYEIYAHIAEARSYALGAAVRGTHTVRGQIAENYDLNLNLGYGNQNHEHSAQFNSTHLRRRSYWLRILNDFAIQP